jgi:RNA polymerase sigma-70 factor, ECF subfamily
LLAEEVKLDLVGRAAMKGRKEVSGYIHNYDHTADWYMSSGYVENQRAILVFEASGQSGAPGYFIFLEWKLGKVHAIKDFRYARYIVDGATHQGADR